MIRISLCMIVKNEEIHIERCLSAIADLVDEIIIVDTGSTDRTKEIVANYTDKVFDFPWIDDFAAARNYAFSLAGEEYILWLDADDVLEGENRTLFAELKATLSPDIDYVSMPYHLTWDQLGNVTSSIRRNRLVKRSRAFRWIGKVHEYLEVYGNTMNSDIAIRHRDLHHDSERNLRIYEKRLAQGEEFNARDLFYFANELKDHRRYREAADYYLKFLDGGEGWVEDNISACCRLADCYLNLDTPDAALQATVRALLYTQPRPETCCRLGYHFLQIKDYHSAVYWYNQAIQDNALQQQWFNLNPACSTWLPHLQLCVCYDRLGQYRLAYEHNERALAFLPDDKQMLHNREYLKNMLQQTD